MLSGISEKDETTYLLESEANKKHLLKALENVDKGNLIYDLNLDEDGKKVVFEPETFEELNQWIKEDKKIFQKILNLIKDIQKDPFSGIGEPTPLKSTLQGYWSRRITDKYRLIYRIEPDLNLLILILPKLKSPFPETKLEDVAGCLKYQGEPKTLQDMENGICQGIQEMWQ